MDQKEPSQKGSACSRPLLSSLLQGSVSLQPTCRKSAPRSPHLSLSHQVPGIWVPLNSDHLGLTPAPAVPTSQLQKLQASLRNSAQEANIAIAPGLGPDLGVRDLSRELESAQEVAVSPTPCPARKEIIPSLMIPGPS